MNVSPTPSPYRGTPPRQRERWSTALPRPAIVELASAARNAATMPGPGTIDDVCSAGMDSFPASDPPSWSPLRVGRPPRRHTDPLHA